MSQNSSLFIKVMSCTCCCRPKTQGGGHSKYLGLFFHSPIVAEEVNLCPTHSTLAQMRRVGGKGRVLYLGTAKIEDTLRRM